MAAVESIAAPPGAAPGFDEAAYLTAHPLVAEAVARGEYASGLAHYEAVGRAQGLALDPMSRKLAE